MMHAMNCFVLMASFHWLLLIDMFILSNQITCSKHVIAPIFLGGYLDSTFASRISP